MKQLFNIQTFGFLFLLSLLLSVGIWFADIVFITTSIQFLFLPAAFVSIVGSSALFFSKAANKSYVLMTLSFQLVVLTLILFFTFVVLPESLEGFPSMV